MIFGGTLALAELHRLQMEIFEGGTHVVERCSNCQSEIKRGLSTWVTDQALNQSFKESFGSAGEI